MRLVALLALLLILQLVLANSVYDANRCGKIFSYTRRRRSLKNAKEATKVEEEEEEIEDEDVEEGTMSGDSSEYGDYDHGDNQDQVDDRMIQKVMGGKDTNLGEYPWVVRLQVSKGGNAYGSCGGTLISKRHVITAAHCFQGRNVNELNCSPDIKTEEEAVNATTVFISTVCQRTNVDPSPCPGKDAGEERKVIRAFIHEEYQKQNCQNGNFDMALLELDKEVDVPHACLPHMHNLDTYKMSKAPLMAGFGKNPLIPGETPRNLQKLVLGRPLGKEECWRSTGAPYPDLLCISETYRQQVCQGDSGSGIMTALDTRAFIVGVLASGTSCRKPEPTNRYILIATDIDIFIGTIDKFMGKKTADLRSMWRNM